MENKYNVYDDDLNKYICNKLFEMYYNKYDIDDENYLEERIEKIVYSFDNTLIEYSSYSSEDDLLKNFNYVLNERDLNLIPEENIKNFEIYLFSLSEDEFKRVIYYFYLTINADLIFYLLNKNYPNINELSTEEVNKRNACKEYFTQLISFLTFGYLK